MTEKKKTTCPSCGHKNVSGAKFCSNCGASMGGSKDKENKTDSRPSYYSYVAIFVFLALLVAIYYNFKLLSKGQHAQPQQNSQAENNVPKDAVHSGVKAPVMDENVLAAKKAKVENEPKNVEAIVDLANYLHDHHHYKEAIQYYDKAIQLEKKAEYLVDAGVSYFNMGNLQKAGEYFNRALKQDPNHPKALFNMGVVYYNQQNMDQLVKTWTLLVKNAPSSPEAREAMKFLDQIKQSGNSE